MRDPALHNANRYLRSPLFRLRLKRFVRSPLQRFWHTIPSYLPFYLLIVLVGYAGYNGWEKETVISTFHMPPESRERPLPFGGETVASMLQDALTGIGKEAEGRPPSTPCDALETKHTEFGGLTARAGGVFELGGRVGVEIKGISAAALVSVAREVLGRERSISGDVLLDGSDGFQLIARADDGGPWKVDSRPLSLEGLKRASCELAQQILATTDKNLLAAALIHREDYKSVIDLYTVWPTDKRDRADALNSLGVALRETEKLNDSITAFRRALSLRKRFPEAHYNLSVALADEGDHEGAIREYEEALLLRPDYPQARGNLCIELLDTGQRPAAIEEYRKALRLNPDDADAHGGLGNALNAGGDHDGAILEYREALLLNRDDSEVHYNLGVVLDVKGDYEGAFAEFSEAVRLNPDDPDPHSDLCQVLNAEGNHQAAIAECQKALHLNAEFPAAHFNLGNVFCAKSQLKAAIAEYREALRLKPDFPEAHYNLSITLDKNGQHNEAAAECKKAITLKPDLQRLHRCPETRPNPA